MRKHTILLLLLTSGLAWAAPRLSGTVVSVDSKSGLLVIRTASGTKTIVVDSKAKVERNGSGSRLGAFHAGEPIQVVISGPLNDNPLHGVEVYDTATAAALPQPGEVSGVYGKPHNQLQTAGGGVTGMGGGASMEGIGQGGASDANMQALQNQQASTTPWGQQNPYASTPYNPRPQTDPVTGQPYQAGNPQATQGPTGQPGGVSAPTSGWSQPQAAPVNNGQGWSQNPPSQVNSGPGWTTGQQGITTSFDGFVRNVDMSRGMIFVAPSTGGQSVAVKVGLYTQVSSPSVKTHYGMNNPGDIPAGSTVRVQGSMSGTQFVATSVYIGK